MDMPWEASSRVRAYLEFNVSSRDVQQAAQDHGKAVLRRFTRSLLKVRSGGVTSTAFMASSQPELYITTAHSIVDEHAPVNGVRADGEQVMLRVSKIDRVRDLAALEPSTHASPSSPALPQPSQPPHVPAVTFAAASLGDTVYAFGFAGDGMALHFSTGTITSIGPRSYTTSAYADHGFSGGPVANIAGEVVGVIDRGDEGTTNKQARMIAAGQVLDFIER